MKFYLDEALCFIKKYLGQILFILCVMVHFTFKKELSITLIFDLLAIVISGLLLVEFLVYLVSSIEEKISTVIISSTHRTFYGEDWFDIKDNEGWRVELERIEELDKFLHSLEYNSFTLEYQIEQLSEIADIVKVDDAINIGLKIIIEDFEISVFSESDLTIDIEDKIESLIESQKLEHQLRREVLDNYRWTLIRILRNIFMQQKKALYFICFLCLSLDVLFFHYFAELVEIVTALIFTIESGP